MTATGTFSDANAGEGKTVTLSGITLHVEGTADYVLADSGNQPAATASILPSSLADAVITLDTIQKQYNGGEQTTTLTKVILDETELISPGNYVIVSGDKGTDQCTYTLVIEGRGNYKDTASALWEITKKPMTVTSSGETVTYDGNTHTITVNVTFYTNGSDRIWIYSRYFSTYTIAYTSAVSYQVTFDDANGNVTQTIVEAGSRVEKPEDPAREGYRFTGWYKGDTAYNFDAPVNADMTLTAHWKEEEKEEEEDDGGDSDSGSDSHSGKNQWSIWQTPDPAISTAEADALAKGLKSRAPKTGDPLPALWLWHLLLLSGAAMIIHSLNTKKASRRA